jgi:hypothetical protein
MSVRDLDKIMGRLSVNENINPYAAAKPVAKVYSKQEPSLIIDPSVQIQLQPQSTSSASNISILFYYNNDNDYFLLQCHTAPSSQTGSTQSNLQ